MKISVTTDVRTRKFSSVDELPPDLQALYEQARTNNESGKLLFSSTGPKFSTRLEVDGVETGWLTKKQWKMILIVLALTALAIAIFWHPGIFSPLLVERDWRSAVPEW